MSRNKNRTRFDVAELETRLVPNNTVPTLVRDINPGVPGSIPNNPLVIGSTLYFAADDGNSGNELWRSDGTSSGTTLVRDIFSTDYPASSNPAELTNVGGLVFFAATNFGDRELWVSDGTSAGTRQVADIQISGSSNPSGLVNVNGTLFFYASQLGIGRELWKSDGTSSGTVLVRDIAVGKYSSVGTERGVNVGGVFYFPANNNQNYPMNGVELWSSNGTSTGTTLVRDIFALSGNSNPQSLVEFKGRVAFAANDGKNFEVWISDGTSTGTARISNITVGTATPAPTGLTNVNGTLFFGASSPAFGFELFKTDGTSSGTALVRDINPADANSDPTGLVNIGGTLFFAAQDGVNGRELWISDGTSAGTKLVSDIIPGNFSSDPQQITNVAGVAYFAANVGDGYELWRSDGTSATLVDIDPNSTSEPSALAVMGTRLFLKANRPDVGGELFTLEEDNVAPTISKIDSTAANGSYYTGQTVPIIITFSEPVTLIGGPLTLLLDTGASVTVAPFSGSTATALYTVGVGQFSTDLNVTAITLAVNALLTDAVGNAANLALPVLNLSTTSNLMINLPLLSPTISDIPNQSINAGNTLGPIAFTVNDADSTAAALTLSVSSSNPGVIPVSAITFAGSGVNRTITVATLAGISGVVTLTVTATDPNGLTASDTFTISQNGPPTITAIANQVIAAGGTVGPLSFDVGGNLTPPANLVVTAVSNNPAIPANAITLTGTGTTRTITVNTPAGVATTSTITVTVTDPSNGFTASQTFTIVQTLSAPTISTIADQAVSAGSTLGPLAFTVTDADSPVASLTLSVASSNPALIPTSAVTFGGSGGNRTLSVNTIAGVSGVTTLTVTVTDPDGLAANTTFTISQNGPPTISAIPNQSVIAGETAGPIPFTVGGNLSVPGNLVVTASASTAVILPPPPPGGGPLPPPPDVVVTLGGSGANRTVTVMTFAGVNAVSTVLVTVTDPATGLTASTPFSVTQTVASTPQGTSDYTVGRGADGSGIVRLFNPDGTEKFSVTPFGADYTCGIRTATADFNGDEIADIVVATGDMHTARAIVYDGSTQAELFNIVPFGDAFMHGLFVSAGDINGDGRAELALTAERGGGARIRVFSPNANGGFVQIADFFGLQDAAGNADTTFHGGARSAIGDINGDGFGDLVFAAGDGGGPRLAVFNGQTLGLNGGPKLTGDFFAFESTLDTGAFVAVGDIDADGRADIVASPGFGGGPRVSIFSGAALLAGQQQRLADFFVWDPAGRGGLRVAVKDLDGDANLDVLVGAGPGDSNRAAGFSGKALVTPGPDIALFDYEAFAGFPVGVFVG